MTAANKSSNPKKELWDFSWVDSFESEACLRYEFAREVSDPETYFTRYDEGAMKAYGITPFVVRPQIPEDVTQVLPPDFIELSQHTFTRTPSPVEDAGERKLREVFAGLCFRHEDGSVRSYPPYIHDKPWLHVHRFWRGILAVNLNHFNTGFRTFDDPSTIQEIVTLSRSEDPTFRRMLAPGPLQLFMVSVNWENDDATLDEDFRKWRLGHRPRSIPSQSRIGRQSLTDSLNALTALRLRHHYFADTATQVTKAVFGKPLYSDSFAWDRAAKRGVEIFRTLYPNAGEPKSIVSKKNPRGRPRSGSGRVTVRPWVDELTKTAPSESRGKGKFFPTGSNPK